NPRDVASEVGDLESVTVYTLDEVGEKVQNSLERRVKAIEEAESIIEEEIDRFVVELKRKRAEAILSTIYRQAEQLRKSEVERAEERLGSNGDLSEFEREVIDDLSVALVNKLLSRPTESIKEAAVSEDYETLETVARVFEVESDRNEEREA
ncbi:MAG: glutamyl-tRNA reductase, partial [Halanaeroarchaeum sp.]